MHAREPDQCHGADDDELVVPLRLGDSTSNVESARDSIDKYLSSSCGKGIKKALVTGVLHYGLAEVTHLSLHPTKYAPVKDNVTGYRFARTVAKDTHAEQIVDAIVAHLEDVHSLTVKVRSESNADKDMCLSVFSLHILDGITMHVLGTNNASEARLPGQTLLRNDVVALFHSHNLASASTNIVRNLPALRNRLPCSHAVPEKSRFTSKKLQWESVLVQYGRLSNAHFAMLCASSCMARRSSASTMCAAPSEPLGCTELVGRGPGRDHSLVCMTTSELDAVQAATVQPWGKLFVMADHSTNSAVSALSGGGGGGGTDGVIAAKQQLLGKWQRERGPSWPESNTIASYTTVDNVAHNPEMLIDEYAAAFRNRKDHNVFSDQKQRAVRRYKKLVGPLSACCGAQMEPSYRLHLHALHALLDTIPENTNGRRSRKKMERRGKQKGGSSSDKQLNAEGSVDAAHECELVDVDALEKKMMENRVFQKCNSIDVIAMLSKYDGRLTGDYCSRARAATIKDRLVANDYRYRQL